MFTMKASRKQNLFGYRAQAIVEFAIALPILLALLVGILEVGRMAFIYSAVTNASREAVRFASAVGLDDSGNAKYQYCDGIRTVAKRSAFLLNLTDSDIAISYDNGPNTAAFDTCTGSVDTGIVVNSGSTADRVRVTVNATYRPMVNLIPIGPQPITSSSARTILGIVDMTTGQSSAPSGSSNTPTATSPSVPATTVPSETPTATATTPSDTPAPTDPSGPIITFTPLPTNTPTRTPTITPTFTPSNTPTMTSTPTLTFTPTATSTPVPGCDSITRGPISVSGNTMMMTITNPHDSVTVLDVRVVWNSVNGGAGGQSGSPLTLQYASLGGIFWTGNNNSGDFTIIPSTTVTIPGNNATSTITFIFDRAYKNLGTTSIVINLSTPGCETFPIQSP